jgi:4,5-dihydroxyphthalate decarboxylase
MQAGIGRMPNENVRLTVAVSEYPHTSAVRSGAIPIEGVEPEILTIKPQIAAFRRMIRNLDFDVCELASTTYMIARSYGYPIIALPVFVHRRFHHSGLLVRPDADIYHPKDLEGKRVGVRAYSVTTGVWTRQVLIEEFGVDSSKITWVVDDEEHVTELKLPSNVIHTADGVSLADMMADGELAAGFHGNAGIGRSGSPTSGGWKEVEARYPDMFSDAAELEAEYFKRTGIYPVHGTIVMKESVYRENPWVAKSLFDAFSTAKNEWLPTLDAPEFKDPSDERYAGLRKIVGPDPLPYGIDANLPTIKALEETAFKQGLTTRRMSVDELFINPETF